MTEGVPPFAVKQPQTGTSRRAEGAGESTVLEAEASASRAAFTVKRRLAWVRQQKLEKGSPWDPKGGTPRSNDLC